jgi:hypothetical protein
MDKPKPRYLKVDAHTLAYLGDFLLFFEKSIKEIAQVKAHSIQSMPAKSKSTSSNS